MSLVEDGMMSVADFVGLRWDVVGGVRLKVRAGARGEGTSNQPYDGYLYLNEDYFLKLPSASPATVVS